MIGVKVMIIGAVVILLSLNPVLLNEFIAAVVGCGAGLFIIMIGMLLEE